MKCNECCGDGYNLRIIKKGNGYTTERVICEHCNGTGEVQTTDTMTKEHEIEKLKRHNKLLKEKLKFLRKQNKELWNRVQNNIVANVAREMSGCKN